LAVSVIVALSRTVVVPVARICSVKLADLGALFCVESVTDHERLDERASQLSVVPVVRLPEVNVALTS
jgi:hypothetical protein